MLLIILAVILVLAITSYQVVQGLFSAMIMTILTVLCALLAFNYYEPLAQLLYDKQPSYADAAALAVLFVIPLLLLRTITDKIIPSNVVMGVWADRIGGGILGLVSAEILVGVLAISIQMLPFGQSIIGYRSHGSDLKRDQSLAPFYPDEFTLWMVKSLSCSGIGTMPFEKSHNDLLLEAFCARNDAGQFARNDAPSDSLELIDIFTPTIEQVPEECEIPQNPRLDIRDPQQIVIVRVSVDELARNEQKHWYRLPGTHFRLTAKSGRNFYPIAYLTAWEKPLGGGRNKYSLYGGRKAPWKCHRGQIDKEQEKQKADTDDIDDENVSHPGNLIVLRPWKSAGGPKKLIIDWLYTIPKDVKLDYLTFRRTIRKKIKEKSEKKSWPSMPKKRDQGNFLDRAGN